MPSRTITCPFGHEPHSSRLAFDNYFSCHQCGIYAYQSEFEQLLKIRRQNLQMRVDAIIQLERELLTT